MIRGILGKKIGMTQLFDESGKVVPVTVIQAGPCVVVQRKTVDQDGYEAVQLGLVEETPRKRPNEPTMGHFKAAGVPPTRHLAEVPVDGDDTSKPGDAILAEEFAVNDAVHIVGTSKGKGYQGVIKRLGFHGGRATHGSMFHRAPGSIGCSAYPSRVFPGAGMPGQAGNKRVTVKNATIVKVDPDRNLLFVKGGVPGARNSYVRIVRAS
jgi:large subunit ribosomal protein L3